MLEHLCLAQQATYNKLFFGIEEDFALFITECQNMRRLAVEAIINESALQWLFADGIMTVVLSPSCTIAVLGIHPCSIRHAISQSKENFIGTLTVEIKGRF